MKHIKAIGGVVAVLAGTMLGARGQDYRTDINPALTYYRSFLLAPDPMTNTDQDYLDSNSLIPVMTRYPVPTAGMFVVRPPGQHPTRKVRVLTELLIEHFG